MGMGWVRGTKMATCTRTRNKPVTKPGGLPVPISITNHMLVDNNTFLNLSTFKVPAKLYTLLIFPQTTLELPPFFLLLNQTYHNAKLQCAIP